MARIRLYAFLILPIPFPNRYLILTPRYIRLSVRQEEQTCSISYFSSSGWAALRCSAPTPFFATIYRARTMSDHVIGLLVAVALAIYLFYTLAHPEKF